MSSSRKRSHEEDKPLAKKPKVSHYGLYNQGATCYLNSVLQVLSMAPELHDRLDSKSRTTDKDLRQVFETMKVGTCGTENITQSLGIENVYQQRDAAECLELILSKVSPQASKVFEGQLTYVTKCSKGHIINEETNPFWTLPLSLNDSYDATYSVKRGFEMVFQTKSYSGDNMVYCNECERQAEATSDKTYTLYGMVNHYGSLRGGHYTATILSDEDKTWYEFNDAHVDKVEEQPSAQTKTSSSAYLLVYRESLKDGGFSPPDKHLPKRRKCPKWLPISAGVFAIVMGCFAIHFFIKRRTS
ncbi:ubiquitin carboxyl-terminal hydrolase 47-like isoform X5 [Eleginops maclovinus]|uniref:ubiquitin carboxyl-terminal hydrolase 47-like isoform X5 n=1 Tax=Eleginops maclovinus TaxID=56733 RepID=UPI0030802C16